MNELLRWAKAHNDRLARARWRDRSRVARTLAHHPDLADADRALDRIDQLMRNS